ncbi:hypothetical protein VaNZ11_005751 [Volvox africanus]|uniref:Uncharacterized protein n=1 Tax=Volvox africanus TaxID=51714 RepID=A0ABQ5RZ66_9CHLO|nr:hypothetical protein VaNZ11_005751 [Volvox africanus]
MISCFCIPTKTSRYSTPIGDMDGKVESNQSRQGNFVYTARPSDVYIIPRFEAAKSGPAGNAAAVRREEPTDTVRHQHPPFPVTNPKCRPRCIARLKATLHGLASAAAECTAAPAAETANTSPAMASASASASTEGGAALDGPGPAALQSPQSYCLRPVCCILAPEVKAGTGGPVSGPVSGPVPGGQAAAKQKATTSSTTSCQIQVLNPNPNPNPNPEDSNELVAMGRRSSGSAPQPRLGFPPSTTRSNPSCSSSSLNPTSAVTEKVMASNNRKVGFPAAVEDSERYACLDQAGRWRDGGDGGDGDGGGGDGDGDGAAIETAILVKNGDTPTAVASPDRTTAAAAASEAGGILPDRPEGGVTWDDASVTPNPTVTTSAELHCPPATAVATAAAAAAAVAATAAFPSAAVSRRSALIQAARALHRQTSLPWTKAAKWSSRTAAAAAAEEVSEPSGGDWRHISAPMGTSPGGSLRIVRLTGDRGVEGPNISAVPRSGADGAPGRHTPLLLRRLRVVTSGGLQPPEVSGGVGRGAAQHPPGRHAYFAGTGTTAAGTGTTSPRTTAPALLARQQTPCPLRWPSTAPVWEDSCDGLNEAMEAHWQASMTPMDTVVSTAAGANGAQRRLWHLAAAAAAGDDTDLDLTDTVDPMLSDAFCTRPFSPGSIGWTGQSLRSQSLGQQGGRGRLASQSSQPHPHLPTLRVQLSLTKLRRLSASAILTLLAEGNEMSPATATTATPATSFSMALRSSNAGGGVGGNGYGIGGGGGRYGAGVMTPTRRGRRRNLAGNEDMSWDAVPPRSPIPNPAMATAATATLLARTPCDGNSETCGRSDGPPKDPRQPSVCSSANHPGELGAVVLPGMEGEPAMVTPGIPPWPVPAKGNMFMDGSAAGSNVSSFLARQGNGMSRLASPPQLLATVTANTADGLSAASTPGPLSSEGLGRSPPPCIPRSRHLSLATTPHPSRSGSCLDLPRPASFSDAAAFAQGRTAPARQVPRRVLYHTGSVRSHAPTEDDSAESLAKLGSELGYGSEKDMDIAASMENLPWGSRLVAPWTGPQLSLMGSGEGLPAGGGLIQVKKLELATSTEGETGRIITEQQRVVMRLDACALLTAGGCESPVMSPVTSGIAGVTSEHLKVVGSIGAGASSRLSRCT